MKKPHEETWDNGREFEVTVCGPELDRDVDAPREVLARAAPEMARLLLDFLSNYEIGEKADAKMRQVLTKAGVPLP